MSIGRKGIVWIIAITDDGFARILFQRDAVLHSAVPIVAIAQVVVESAAEICAVLLTSSPIERYVETRFQFVPTAK